MDVDRLRALIAEVGREKIPLCHADRDQQFGRRAAGLDGQRARGRRGLPRASAFRFYIDACRFAENAWFIKQREPGYADRTADRDRARDVLAWPTAAPCRPRRTAWPISAASWPPTTPALAAARAGSADPHRGLPDLRRAGGPRPRGDRRRPRRGAGRGLPALPHHLDQLPGRAHRRQPVCRSSSRRAAMPIYIDAAAFLPHIPALRASRAGAGGRSCTGRPASGPWRSGRVMFGRRDPDTGAEHPRRWSWCGWPSPGGSTPRATSTTWSRRSSRSGRIARRCAATGYGTGAVSAALYGEAGAQIRAGTGNGEEGTGANPSTLPCSLFARRSRPSHSPTARPAPSTVDPRAPAPPRRLPPSGAGSLSRV